MPDRSRKQSYNDICYQIIGKLIIVVGFSFQVQKLYGRYMRAEKSRKSLTYQKKYLVLLLGGFRKSETQTLSLIAKMGSYPSFSQPSARFPASFTKFRIAVRVVIAMKRMEFLVKKSKTSIRQVIESSDPTERQSGQKTNSLDLKYGSGKTKDPSKTSSFSHVSFDHNVSSQPLPVSSGVNNYNQHSLSSESKDISFADVLPSNKDCGDYGMYTRDDYKTNEPQTNSKFYSNVSHVPKKPETFNERR